MSCSFSPFCSHYIKGLGPMDYKTMEDVNNYNSVSEGVKSMDISNQISVLIEDVEEMRKNQERRRENFRQNAWHTFDDVNSLQLSTNPAKSMNENDEATMTRDVSWPSDRHPFKSYWQRLFGEIAYRLDSKIITLTTSGIYSKLITFSVNDFYHQIRKACDEESWVVSSHRAHYLYQRLRKIAEFLSDYGYSLNVHAQFSRCMQHKYGRLKNKYYCYLTNWLIKNSHNSMLDLLSSLAQDTFEERNILVLYRSLLALCEHDEYPF